MLSLSGTKAGMTQVFFAETGKREAVTVVALPPNRVSQLKTENKDGYTAVQLTAGEKSPKKTTKPLGGHFKKAGVLPGVHTLETRVSSEAAESFKVGDEIAVTHFQEGQFVDVYGVSKGKGFQGGVKRHNFRTQDATHGNSLSHRAIGSTGQCQTPGRVFKGKKMPGQMGNVRCTVQNQQIVSIDDKQHFLLLRGAIPGPIGGKVVVSLSKKQRGA